MFGRDRSLKPRAGDVLTAIDRTRYRIAADGSIRRDPPKLRGKARVKAAKRARRAARGVAA